MSPGAAPDAVNAACAWLVDAAARSQGDFRLVLSGGNSPKPLYQALARSPWRERMPWQRTQFFFGDERMVPYGHPDSNYGMARTALLDGLMLSAGQIHPIPTGPLATDAAALYDAMLRGLPARPDVGLFDVVLLGLGEDGHTASLFPGSAALDERRALAVGVTGFRPESRVTLTYLALCDSVGVAFLVTGAGKQAMLARLMAGDADIPAGRVRALGETRVFHD